MNQGTIGGYWPHYDDGTPVRIGDVVEAHGARYGVSVDPDKERLEIVVAQPGDKYEKHFVGLNETTNHIVRDISGVDVDSYRCKIVINPDMFIPFDPSLATGGADE